MSRIMKTVLVLTFFAVSFACSDALAVHLPKGWLQKDQPRYDSKDQVLQGFAGGHFFVFERSSTWKNGPNLLIYTGFDGFCVIAGKTEGMRLHPVSAGRIIRAGFGRDEGLEIGLFDGSYKRLFEVRIRKPVGDAYLWAEQCQRERATEVLAAHLAMGSTLAEDGQGGSRQLRRYSRSIADPLFTYLFNLFGKDRDWLNPRWDGRPSEVDPPRKSPELPGTQPQPHPQPQPQPQPRPDPQPSPATAQKIDALIRSIDNSSFSGDKLSLLALFCRDNWLDVESAAQILPRFAFSSDRLKALEHLAFRLTDRDNAFMLLNSFDFSSDKEAARKIIENARR